LAAKKTDMKSAVKRTMKNFLMMTSGEDERNNETNGYASSNKLPENNRTDRKGQEFCLQRTTVRHNNAGNSYFDRIFREPKMRTDIWEKTAVKKEVTYTIEVDGKFIIVQNVPARVCLETGERFFSLETVEQLQRTIWEKRKPRHAIQTPVFNFAA